MVNMYKWVIGFCLLYSGLFAQVRTPKYSNEFLAIGVGARGLALSGTQTALANDVTAAYWNPAGLLCIPHRYEASLMHAEYFAGIAKYDYAGMAIGIDSVSHLGDSLLRFGVDDIADTRFLYDADGVLNYDNITFFSAADYALLLSYARKMKLGFLPALRFGANAKVIHRTVGNFATAWGFGFDVGLQADVGKWKFGMVVRDITGTFNAWSHNTALVADVYARTGNVIPENSLELTLPRALLGIGRYIRFSKKAGLTAGLDLETTFDGRRNNLFREVLRNSGSVSMDARMGLEAHYRQLVFLRLGVGNVQKTRNLDGTYATQFQPNFGLGFRITKLNQIKLGVLAIDYALTDIGDKSEALYSHVFSLKAGF
jgi:hypothetical protein